MSLTDTDLSLIRGIVQETVRGVVNEVVPSVVNDAVERGISPLRGEIWALRNDVKEIYTMLATHEHRMNRTDTRVGRLENTVFPAAA